MSKFGLHSRNCALCKVATDHKSPTKLTTRLASEVRSEYMSRPYIGIALETLRYAAGLE